MPSDIGPRIRDARLAAGLSLSALAEAIGVHRMTIWRWEVGDQRPTGLALRAVMVWLEGRESRQPSIHRSTDTKRGANPPPRPSKR